MHIVVPDGAGNTDRADSSRSGLANVLMRLFVPLRRVMLGPLGIVVDPDVGHGKPIERRAFGHRDSRTFDFSSPTVDDRHLSSLQAELAFIVVTIAAQHHAWLQPNPFVVCSGCDQYGISGNC